MAFDAVKVMLNAVEEAPAMDIVAHDVVEVLPY